MTMSKVNAYLARNRATNRKTNLSRLEELLKRLANPHKNLNYIHITGSNGKGSTAAMFQSVLREAGLKVGLFTSPHLENINERIRINNIFIKDSELIRLVNKMEAVVLKLEAEIEEKFYAFELLTALSFLYFQEKGADIVILEVGIGGRLDATNIIEKSELAVITSIGMDHAKTLGETKEAIIREKIQILKENGQMVIGPIEKKLKIIALNWAKKVKGVIKFIEPREIKISQLREGTQIFDYKSYHNIQLSFLGKHQLENAAIVLEGASILKNKGYPISDEAIYKGLAKVYWPGRFEKISDSPLFYIDGAHNLASVDRLVETLTDLFPKRKFYFVVGMMKDKDYEQMLEKVYPLAKEFILISPDPNRGFDLNEVAELIKRKTIPVTQIKNTKELFAFVDKKIAKNEIVIQFGSLYLVGALKEAQSNLKKISSNS